MSWLIGIYRWDPAAREGYCIHEASVDKINLTDAIDAVLGEIGLAGAEEGDYQITASYQP